MESDGKENGPRRHHDPGKHPYDREKQRRESVEYDHGGIGPGQSAAPKQQKGNGQVESGAGPAEQVSRRLEVEQRAEQGQMRPGEQPPGQGLGSQQPTRVDLGEAGEEIGQADLELEDADLPAGRMRAPGGGVECGIKGKGSVGGNPKEQERDDGYEIIMI